MSLFKRLVKQKEKREKRADVGWATAFDHIEWHPPKFDSAPGEKIKEDWAKLAALFAANNSNPT